mgnify:CR=1 FL=1
MRLFLGVGVVLFAVIPTLLTLRMNFTRRIASVLIGCAAAALLAYVAGADMPKAFLKAADLEMDLDKKEMSVLDNLGSLSTVTSGTNVLGDDILVHSRT